MPDGLFRLVTLDGVPISKPMPKERPETRLEALRLQREDLDARRRFRSVSTAPRSDAN